ncbi:TPA: hypothetical protein I8455_001523 [Aeromonas hydrophila]|nr:transposase [Aeromonas hydrophila]HAT2247541.1 hypothetical protein [Aeromonas hydrophila]HAT2381180.1 hypothetical protein [Aeromonas hydrophila]HAT2414930.1 hypothetical protein [Aeromonas hydrophila]HAT2526883.1 hypothetical protein [Aeromonas hydrophila]
MQLEAVQPRLGATWLVDCLNGPTIKRWHCQTHLGCWGRDFHYSDNAIDPPDTKVLFKLPQCALEGLVSSLFTLMNVPLQSPDYSCISRRAKQPTSSTVCQVKGQ